MSDIVRIAGADPMSYADIGLVGGGVREFVWHGRAVIPLDTETARRAWYSGATLAPWPNRLRGGSWTSEGVQYEGDCNDAARGHALHGLVYDVAFEVVAQTPAAVTLAYTLGDDAIYPFPVRVEISYALTERGLTSSLTATNLGDVRVPIALGVHPYFPYDDATELVTSATVFNVNDETLIPTGELADVRDLGITTGAHTPLLDRTLDHCFSGMGRDGALHARTQLHYSDGVVVTVWQDERLGYTQMFTKPDFPWAAGVSGAIGIEPQSAPADALNSGTDLTWLNPADSTTVQWGIEVASA